MLGQAILTGIWQLLTEEKFMSNELWRWGALLGLLLGALIVGKILSFYLKRRGSNMKASGRGQFLGTLLESLAGPIGVLLVSAALYAGGYILKTAQISTQTGGSEAVELTELKLLIEVQLWLKV